MMLLMLQLMAFSYSVKNDNCYQLSIMINFSVRMRTQYGILMSHIVVLQDIYLLILIF